MLDLSIHVTFVLLLLEVVSICTSEVLPKEQSQQQLVKVQQVACDSGSQVVGGKAAFDSIDHIAYLSRQSDRDSMQTKFLNTTACTTKNKGGDYAGMLLSLLIIIISKKGIEMLLQQQQLNDHFINI